MGGQKWSPWNPSTPLNLIRLLFLRSVVSSPASPGNSETRFSSISGEATTYVWNAHFFCSLFSVAFYPLPSLTSLPTTLGMGAVGKWLNQKESRIYGVILCFINSFYDIWGWNCFQRQVSLFGGFSNCNPWRFLALSALPLPPNRNTVMSWICPASARGRLSTFLPPAFWK